MTLRAYSVVLLAALTAQTRAVFSQSAAAIPLWPCYSVHKLPNITDTFEFRYVGVTDCDCVFTLEGPANSRLKLQLHDVFLEPPTAPPYGGGYGYGYPHGYMDCSRGAVKIFNFATSGGLTVSDTVCSTMQLSQNISTDTNMAVITSTFHRGQFLLRVNIIPGEVDNITDLVPPSLFTTTTTVATTTTTDIPTTTLTSSPAVPSQVRTTVPPTVAPSTTSTTTTTTTTTTMPSTRTTRRPVPQKLVLKPATTTTKKPTTTPLTTTTEATTTRAQQDQPTMMVQAEFLVQETEDVSMTGDTAEPESSEVDMSTTESTTNFSEDVQSNLV